MTVEKASEATRERWFGKGVAESNGAMLELGDYAIKVGNTHKEKLAERGFGSDKHALMATLYEELKAKLSGRGELKMEKQLATRNLAAAIDAAKDHVSLLNVALPPLLRDREQSGPTPTEILPNAIKRSPRKILNHLVETRSAVELLNEELRPYFMGASALEAHDKVFKALTEASTSKGAKAKELPYETRLLHETKGALLELIEDMNRIGRFVYRGQAEQAAVFNKDLLLKARRKARQTATDTDSTIVEEAETA